MAPDPGMDKEAPDRTPVQPVARCHWCGRPRQIVHVHGHGQCAHCGTNSLPCCDGDSGCEDDSGPISRSL
ncbi:MAG: hypothetical protein CMJ32_10130 [Phycisphaerae bacterium]|nr:hypothetical protein [Phycisphaerae bacterium]